ncbi:hypothetical protein Y1Q_0020040 [Alligator mississippiensis]|uniref:Uncharacterized protein n=1 Tax=Alligator mississippiensis TaxID=8496 RepID=A0A151LYU6_ALLMI|nr:hypothetical protein Y1Q_0020040 [Alligator mississippiensis]
MQVPSSCLSNGTVRIGYDQVTRLMACLHAQVSANFAATEVGGKKQNSALLNRSMFGAQEDTQAPVFWHSSALVDQSSSETSVMLLDLGGL